jgi:hypothetical protein
MSSSQPKRGGTRADIDGSWYRDLLATLANVKLGFLLLSLVLVSGVAFVGSFLLARGSGPWFSFASGFAKLVADAALSSAVVGFAYEWLVRRETSRGLELLYRNTLHEHEANVVNAVVREVPRALLLDRSVQASVLFGPAKIEEIIRGALSAKLGDEEMSGSIYNGLLQKTFSYTERFVGLRVEVTLSSVDANEPAEVRDNFYDVVVALRYRTKLAASRFIFARALDHDQFNARVRHPDYIFTWRVEESRSLPKDSPKALELYRFAVDDVELPKVARTTDDGAYEIVCESPDLEAKRGAEVTIHYAVMTKLHKHDHVFFYTAVRPTRGITVIFNYARTDIESVLTYDFFVSSHTPVIYQLPREHPHTVVVELDEWVFPKGGVAFVWRLKGEQEEPAHALSATDSTAPTPNASGTGDGIPG